MTEEMLQILIGKYLDGEISPVEGRLLEQALQKDSQAKKLFEQLQDLHRASQEVIDSEIIDRGKTAEEIFERAWQQTKQPLHRVINMSGRLRFAVGLAAGLIIGLTLHFVLSNQLISTDYEPPVSTVAQDISRVSDDIRPKSQPPVPDSSENVIRNVDWYSFTDEGGRQWLIERVRQDVVRPAVYSEGL
ncbi:MAG: hypothetical protein ACE5NM_04955 [Sedimentisphaerales bacterium]